MAGTYLVAKIQRETAKAILVSYCVDAFENVAATIWIPKSQANVYHVFNEGSVVYKLPAWFINKNHLGNDTVSKKIVDELISWEESR